ncbi:hypothetical protein IFM58399_09687 [Aspergillus lentulus]|nr:uncharacterized protein IFM58399_09687 [Aspergillus lentulus]GFF53878.1 hypothetical protein IFM58399_09687 [Aspergillus lentulus]GFF74266.1 hypothetical protein IFM60648_04149 [Aspergillus lentulus]GFF75342.1 hypothetical protein IFM47457_03872 [Aspergillus lentulus]GFF78373.1 hypothetical protein IFM62136_09798 [Aspergillus lentulus]GFG15074.1 hypothetical protein IFM61392_08786 [Aspergillus lentulus]
MILQFVTVASALALAPTAVVAKQAAAAFVTVNTLDTCPKGVAQEILKPGPKVVTTPYTCEQIKISHGLDVSYYSFDVEPLTKDTVTSCRAVKVFDNTACQGFPTLWIPFDSPLEDRCIPERVFSDEVKAISVQLDCEDPPAKKELPGPKQVAEQLAEQVQQAQQAEHAPKQEAHQGSKQEEAAPKQEEAAPKQEQEREQGSEQEEQDEQDPEAAPERKAANPADSLGLAELTKMLGFR